MLNRIPNIVRGSFFALTIAFGGSQAVAEGFEYGKRMFEENCAACHGQMGEGDGAAAALFNSPISSLRMLAERNEGHFPFSEVYQTIKGSRELRAHGTVEMPIWGSVFREEAIKGMYAGVEGEEIVQGRILGIVYYLQSIQK